MKTVLRSPFSVLVLAVLCLIPSLFFACYNDSAGSKNRADEFFEDNPTTIMWDEKTSGVIKSYEADVEVYSMNNRKDLGTKLQDKYRIIMKEINGKMYTRLDFDPAFSNGAFRSIISDGSEVILFDTKTEKIEQRMVIGDKISPNLKFFEGDSYLSRVNLSLIKSNAKKLAFDVAEDEESNVMVIELPSQLIKINGLDKRISTSIFFDMEEETLLSTEIVEVSDNGTEITTTTQPVYIEDNGVPVKIGEITVIDSKVSELVKGFEEGYPVINTPDDVPTIDKEAADKMVAEGSAMPNNNVIFGNPADLSSTETVITMCKEVKLNQVDEKAFKLIRGGK
jgi:hypothetical protein